MAGYVRYRASLICPDTGVTKWEGADSNKRRLLEKVVCNPYFRGYVWDILGNTRGLDSSRPKLVYSQPGGNILYDWDGVRILTKDMIPYPPTTN